MKTSLLLIFLLVSVMTAAESLGQAKQEKKQSRYTAPDGGVTVLVVPIGKEAGRAEYESRVEFKSTDGKIACAIDYSRGLEGQGGVRYDVSEKTKTLGVSSAR